MVMISPIIMLINPTQVSAATTNNNTNRLDSNNYRSTSEIYHTSRPISSTASTHTTVSAPSPSSQDGDFTAQAALSLTRATQTNNIVSTRSYYDIMFRTSTSGVIKTVEMDFPPGTYVGIALLVEAVGIGPGKIAASGTTATGQKITYTVDNAVNIPIFTTIRIQIANINNPSTPSDSLTVSITTKNSAGNIIDGPTPTAPYTIKQISTNGGDAGQNDKFGIKKIYASKPGGEQWFMDMQDPINDPRTNPPPMTRNADGSWRVTSSQVRYSVFTSSGYDPDQVVKDHSILATRGYMQSPNDWKNVELTGQVKFNSGGDDEWTWYARGGRHTGNGWPDGCEGSSLKGMLEYTSGRVRWAKEQWHVSYVFAPWLDSPASADGKFVGFKAVMYNFQLNGETAVKLEIWVDPNNDNQWQKVYDFIDQGGWGSEGEECNGAPDQIITWGGPIATFRWDDGTSIDIKNFSVREIVPPSQ
jgi:hypothetical protein